MYSQNYPVVDNVVYPQQQQQQQFQQRLQSPLHPTMMQQQQQIPLQHRKEPLPSATDAKPNITLSISEIAEFSSTMVYLMWHARRQSQLGANKSYSRHGQHDKCSIQKDLSPGNILECDFNTCD
ncbi:hypothetical protein G6F42_016327 [Rhizopus arrhizus]|nr:hypothetical protein G6F42_016327 [Rhizopus arrhizus]